MSVVLEIIDDKARCRGSILENHAEKSASVRGAPPAVILEEEQGAHGPVRKDLFLRSKGRIVD